MLLNFKATLINTSVFAQPATVSLWWRTRTDSVFHALHTHGLSADRLPPPDATSASSVSTDMGCLTWPDLWHADMCRALGWHQGDTVTLSCGRDAPGQVRSKVGRFHLTSDPQFHRSFKSWWEEKWKVEFLLLLNNQIQFIQQFSLSRLLDRDNNSS